MDEDILLSAYYNRTYYENKGDNVSKYVMRCPVHFTDMTVKESEKVTVNLNGTKTKMPIFHCEKCQRYYLFNSELVPGYVRKTKTVFREQPVYFCGNKCITVTDKTNESIWKSGKSARNKRDDAKKAKKKEEKTTKREAVKEKVARIHVIKEKELESKLKANISSVKKTYPQVMSEQMKFHDLITKIFPSSLKQQIVVRNESFTGNNGNVIRRVSIYSKSSSYLSRRLPEDTFLSFGGKFVLGEFVIDEMRILEHPILKEDDIETEMTFYYDGQNLPNWLYNVTENAAEHEQHMTGEIASWNEYLDWKRQLAELRIRGLKYIGFRFDVENREMTFLVVSEGKEYFDEFRRFLRRNEVSAFSNNYSNDRWRFEFNRDYQDWQNNDGGVSLTFIRYGRQYSLNDIDDYDWDSVREHVKNYEKDDHPNTRFLAGGINRNYFEPYVMELVFELSSNANTLIDRQIRRFGHISDDIEEILAEEFYGDGYIATSQIGDFALLHRLKGAVNSLVMGKAASHGLDEWLFDITKARRPEKIEKITEWQNKEINDKQKEAVEKIISVPDVCLIQGPPGTGKTTVIAEAIYQLVIRNKRVLVASQANLAVDNALERLISNPKIRAIRLGSAKKIDSSVSNITEGNVLETFYESIVGYIDENYVSKWNKIDALAQGGKTDYQRFGILQNEIEGLQNKIAEKEFQISQIEKEWNSEQEYSLQNNLRTEKINLVLLKSFCQGATNDLELMLDKNGVIKIWEVVEPVLKALQNVGLWITRVGIDTNDLDSSVRISRANDNLKYILIHAKNVAVLLDKLKVSADFGGDTKELEELKIQESLLTEKMLSNPTPEVIGQWQEIKKKIAGYNASGIGMSDAEIGQFDNKILSTMNDEAKKEYMINVLNQAMPLIQLMNQKVEEAVQILLNDISEKQVAFDEKSSHNEQQKQECRAEIEALKKEIKDKTKIREAVLRKYKATPDNLSQRITEICNQAKKKYQTTVERDDWEDVFRGLEDWVQDIPDYSQEKDIYLKDFINGCNVVGVSCTENTKTLIENGFDDFDVVIIDEVSKATPPELLIPMLRGRKIVLVGDHRQLPPLFNEHEKTYQEVAEQQEEMDDVIVPLTMEDFDKYKDMVTASLFERYFENADNKIKETLIYQYRMHTDIMDIINIFYDEYLKDGNEDNYTYDTKAHYLSIPSTSGTEMIIPERHAYWFDSSELAGEKIYEQRRPGSSSAENLVEAEMILELLKKMELQYANRTERKTPVSIGVISFYYDQVALIRQMLRNESFHSIDVEVNTVDRFQGKEKEIILVSLVRNVKNFHHNVNSHIAAFQRINVAFSRAQNMLVIVGAKDMYVDQPVKLTDMNNGAEKTIMAYKQIIEMMDQRGTYFTSDEIITDVRAEEILQDLRQRQGGYEG